MYIIRKERSGRLYICSFELRFNSTKREWVKERAAISMLCLAGVVCHADLDAAATDRWKHPSFITTSTLCLAVNFIASGFAQVCFGFSYIYILTLKYISFGCSHFCVIYKNVIFLKYYWASKFNYTSCAYRSSLYSQPVFHQLQNFFMMSADLYIIKRFTQKSL